MRKVNEGHGVGVRYPKPREGLVSLIARGLDWQLGMLDFVLRLLRQSIDDPQQVLGEGKRHLGAVFVEGLLEGGGGGVKRGEVDNILSKGLVGEAQVIIQFRADPRDESDTLKLVHRRKEETDRPIAYFS